MKTNTNYLRMSQKTQQILLIIYSIFEKQIGRNDCQKISFDYTNSKPEYPEKILNFKCILGSGNFKIVNFNHIFGEKAYEVFQENLHILFPKTIKAYQNTSKQREGVLMWLFEMSTEKAEAGGVNFNDSVKNLFNKITTNQVIKSKDELHQTTLKVLLIEKVGEEFSYFHLYLYDDKTKKFSKDHTNYKLS